MKRRKHRTERSDLETDGFKDFGNLNEVIKQGTCATCGRVSCAGVSLCVVREDAKGRRR